MQKYVLYVGSIQAQQIRIRVLDKMYFFSAIKMFFQFGTVQYVAICKNNLMYWRAMEKLYKSLFGLKVQHLPQQVLVVLSIPHSTLQIFIVFREKNGMNIMFVLIE